MSTVTKSSTPTATPVATTIAPDQQALIAQAELLLRLEDLVPNQKLALETRLLAEEDKLFKSLSSITTATDTARLTAALKTYDVALVQIESEAKQLQRFIELLKRRVDQLPSAAYDAMFKVLENKLSILVESQAKERKDVASVAAEIEALKHRIERLAKTNGQAKKASKAY